MAEAAQQAPGTGARLRVDGDVLSLGGDLDLASVGAVLEPGRAAIGGLAGGPVVLDLSGVVKSDSAGLALVVDWVRTARRRNLSLSIRGVPEQLARIARVSGLLEFMSGEEPRAA